MDAIRDDPTKSSQKEKDKYHVLSLICGVQNKTQVDLSMKQTQT